MGKMQDVRNSVLKYGCIEYKSIKNDERSVVVLLCCQDQKCRGPRAGFVTLMPPVTSTVTQSY